ncbi:MAG: RsmB/NOP family class I SAM-dependent RNA methyltransferase [Nitrososphaerota archaeon]
MCRDTGISPSSALYFAFKRKRYTTRELRMARKILHIYSIYRRSASIYLDKILPDTTLDWMSKTLLELIASCILGQMNLGDISTLVSRLRQSMGKNWPEQSERFLGLLRYMYSRPRREVNYPDWFVKYLEKIIGKVEAEHYMDFQDNVKPPIYCSLNTLRMDKENILKIAEEKNVILKEDSRLPGIYIVETSSTKDLKTLMNQGLIVVHDFSSYYAVKVLEPRLEDIILDVCSAPGTKTWLTTLEMRNNGIIFSIDSSWKRIRSQRKRMTFLNAKIVKLIQADATKSLPIRIEADKVLVDPPCSSTGLIWREPYYRWMIRPRHIRMFANLQSNILWSSSRNVKKGGYLVYSTCSITVEENEYVIEDFLKTHPDFELVEPSIDVGSTGLRGLVEARRLYPHSNMCNGFFIALLKRRY